MIVLAFAIPTNAQSEHENDHREPLRIRVHLYNDARVLDKQVDAAEQVAARVLGKAGIELEWSQCTVTRGVSGGVSSPCDSSLLPKDLLVYFVGPLEAHFKWVHENALGYSIIPDAQEPATMAYVSYPRIRKLSASTSMGEANLLGLAVAHEVAHLLFAVDEHSNQGIMRSLWKLRDLHDNAWEEFELTRGQAQRLRSAVQGRLQDGELRSNRQQNTGYTLGSSLQTDTRVDEVAQHSSSSVQVSLNTKGEIR